MYLISRSVWEWREYRSLRPACEAPLPHVANKRTLAGVLGVWQLFRGHDVLDNVVAAPDHNRRDRHAIALVDLLVHEPRRNVDEVARAGFGTLLQASAPADRYRAGGDADNAVAVAVMVCAGAR